MPQQGVAELAEYRREPGPVLFSQAGFMDVLIVVKSNAEDLLGAGDHRGKRKPG